MTFVRVFEMRPHVSKSQEQAQLDVNGGGGKNTWTLLCGY